MRVSKATEMLLSKGEPDRDGGVSHTHIPVLLLLLVTYPPAATTGHSLREVNLCLKSA